MLNLWLANVDYLVLRSTVTSAGPTQIFRITEWAQQQLRLHGHKAVLRRRKGGAQYLRSTDLDLQVAYDRGAIHVDIFCKVDALHLRPGVLWARLHEVHALLQEIPGLALAPLQVHRIDLGVTFSGGGIGAKSIRRIQSRKKPRPEPVPYIRGLLYLYNKSHELRSRHKLRKRYILALCQEQGYDPGLHGDLWRLEYRLQREDMLDLGFPDLEAVWQRLMDTYPLLRNGSRRGKAVDPAWRRLRMATFPRPWDESPAVWRPTPMEESDRNRGLGLIKYGIRLVLGCDRVAVHSAREVLAHLEEVYFRPGSVLEADLLDTIGMAREEHLGKQGQQVLPFMASQTGVGMGVRPQVCVG